MADAQLVLNTLLCLLLNVSFHALELAFAVLGDSKPGMVMYWNYMNTVYGGLLGIRNIKLFRAYVITVNLVLIAIYLMSFVGPGHGNFYNIQAIVLCAQMWSTCHTGLIFGPYFRLTGQGANFPMMAGLAGVSLLNLMWRALRLSGGKFCMWDLSLPPCDAAGAGAIATIGFLLIPVLFGAWCLSMHVRAKGTMKKPLALFKLIVVHFGVLPGGPEEFKGKWEVGAKYPTGFKSPYDDAA
jgi:hypothetical protein